MASFNELMTRTPKWALVAGASVLLGILGYGMYYLAFGMQKKPEEEQMSISVDMPDAEVNEYNTSAMEEFQKDRNRRSSAQDYWDSLGDDQTDPNGASKVDPFAYDSLDPAVYSELERQQIRDGVKTKEQVDREHEETARRARELQEAYLSAGGSGYTARQKVYTQAQQDSMYMARLDMAYKMAAKYSQQPAAPAPQPAETEPKVEEEPDRTIDLDGDDVKPSTLPTDGWSDDGIITSLDTPSQNGVVHYGGKVRRKPVKATFLKNEKLKSGNRVIMRLMDDMTLADGTVIPASTHITGTCNIGRRMKINVTMLHYAGRMFPVDISVYDNDGTEGIYCPLVEESNKSKKVAKKVAQDAISTAGTLVGTVVTGNPFLGSLATNGIRTATSAIGSDGSVSVSVSSGYEFYVYENLKEEDEAAGKGNK